MYRCDLHRFIWANEPEGKRNMKNRKGNAEKMEMAFTFDPESEGLSFKDQIVYCAAHMFDETFGNLPNVCKVPSEIFQNLEPAIEGDGFVVKVCEFRPDQLEPGGRYWLLWEEE